MNRFFWPSYLVLLVLVALGFGCFAADPCLEQHFFPIRGPQSIALIEPTPARLCYAWTFVKLRGMASDNVDSFLELNGVPSGVVAPYDMDTGYP